MTRVLAVIGDPVAHSLSPAMHNAAIAALGLDAEYVAVQASGATFEAVARNLLAAGGAFNVTVPFKRQAAAMVSAPTELVRRTGACNTVWGDADGPDGDNTDVEGVREAARLLMEGRRVDRAVVIGTGGSARAAAVAVADEWPGSIVEIMSRDAERAGAFVEWARQAGVETEAASGRFDGSRQLVVNATPLGLNPDDPLPLSWEDPAGHPVAVLDLVYARGETAWVRWARRHRLPAMDGRSVLVAQGAAAFARFFGVPGPVDVMRKAVEDVLRA